MTRYALDEFTGARFWWDRVNSGEKSAHGDLDLICGALDWTFDDQLKDELRHTYLETVRPGTDKAQVETCDGMIVPTGYGLFMAGTTTEIQDGIMAATMSKLPSGRYEPILQYFALYEPMLIRYYRRK